MNRRWHSVQEIWILANTFCLVKEMLPEDEREESVTSDAMEALIGAIYILMVVLLMQRVYTSIYFERFGEQKLFLLARLSCREIVQANFKK